MREIEEQLRGSPGPDSRSQALIALDSIASRARAIEEWALADLTAQEMIDQDPSYAGGYYAMGLAAEHDGNVSKAIQQFSIAEKLWSEADKDLPELKILRAKLAMELTEFSQNRQEYLKTAGRQTEVHQPEQPVRANVSIDSARLRGNPSAPVTIVEFSDFQCPFCRKVQSTLKALLARYPGSLRLGYRDFPLQGLHGQAELAAEASRCAAEQGKFWQYHDALFANPDKLNHNGLFDLARNLKFNEGQFDSCLSSGKYRAEVRRDLQDGIRAGVLGTPGIFINGILVSGAQSEDIFVTLIDKELAVTTNSQAHP